MAGVNLMNYSILQSELEQETGSLEDMHMFFVAFNQRQNKLLQGLEKADMIAQANDRQNLLYIDDELVNADSPLPHGKPNLQDQQMKPSDRPFSPKVPMNVVILRKEVDLE